MKHFLLTSFFSFVLLLFMMEGALAQGITSASLTGMVTDAGGEGVPGANVIAVHEPSGTQYGAVTRLDGRYSIQGMRVGGPYTVRVSFVGYQTELVENINLKLGQTFELDLVLTEDGVELQEVEVTSSRNPVLNDERTGPATNISDAQINSMPSIARGLNDFTRLTPQATTSGTSGISFAGQNNRYNQFAIDGTVNNDVFGLSATGTNGGQTGVQPVSLDAIQEVQVVLAPYDVRLGGFTGGGINAITRSGNNSFEGSLYFFGNNENLVGKSPDEERVPLDEYTDFQTGFRLGGPVVKDKLFFFVNGEITRRTSPLLFTPGTGTSNITLDELQRVEAVTDRFNYEPGQYSEINDERNSNKLFARIDWNISQDHHLTLRHSYTYGEELNNSRNPNLVRFFNNGVFFPSTTNSSVMELRSKLSSNLSNELRLGYTAVRDDREPLGAPFPSVTIRLGGGRQVQLGSEPFSVANQLDQDVFTLTNNLTLYQGRHTLTFGTHNEFFSTYNLFIRENYGAYLYNSLEEWETVGTANEVYPVNFNYSYSRTNNPQQGAEFNAYQLGFYVQDEFQATTDLRLTFGLRLDLPTFNDEPTENPAFNQAFAEFGVGTNRVPGMQAMFSPRLGFNWDATGDKSTQIRGGVGVFTGRVPFVWISNQYTNTGNEFGRVFVARGNESPQNPGDFPEEFRFRADPFNQPEAPFFGLSERVSEINVTDPDFKFPQVLRGNLALDQLLPGEIIATLEGIYSKNLNNIDYRNLNIQEAGTLAGPDTRRYFSGYENEEFNDVILLTNTSEGYSYSLTGQLQKFFETGLNASLAYTYGRSRDINGGSSSQAFSNWRYVENVNGANDPQLGWSDFDIRSRVVGSLGYRQEFAEIFSTTFSLFYNGQSGIPFSYVYDGDLNNDRTFGNDLLYVPASSEDIAFVGNPEEQQAQWEALNSYIEGDDYLSTVRGQYVERNAARLPWTNQFDARFMFEVKLNTGGEIENSLQFTFDVFNVGNLLNRNWGRQYFVSNNSFSLIEFEEYEELEGGGLLPLFSYDGGGLTDGTPYFVSDFNSRWRGQLGVRYLFQ